MGTSSCYAILDDFLRDYIIVENGDFSVYEAADFTWNKDCVYCWKYEGPSQILGKYTGLW